MNEETYEDINIKPISLDNEGHLNIEQVEEGGTPIRLHSNGGGYILPIATRHRLGGIKVGDNLTITSDGTLSATGGGSSVTPIVIDKAENLILNIFDNFYNNGIEYYDTEISEDLAIQFNSAISALEQNLATPVFFWDGAQYIHATNYQPKDGYGQHALLGCWEHWASPAWEQDPAKMFVLSFGIQDSTFWGSMKALELNSAEQPPMD